jgi:hypothetical protein
MASDRWASLETGKPPVLGKKCESAIAFCNKLLKGVIQWLLPRHITKSTTPVFPLLRVTLEPTRLQVFLYVIHFTPHRLSIHERLKGGML